MTNKEILKFKRMVSILPPAERKLPIVKLKDKFYTWEDILREVNKKTEISSALLKELKKMGII